MDLLDMVCLFDGDGGVLPPERSNASVRNFPSDATLNAEAGAAKSARGATGAAPTPLSPSSRRERGGEVLAGREGEGWTGSASRAGGPAAQPPQARGAAAHLVPVQLRYQGPADADVAVAGSWDGWTARVPLAYIGGGVHARLLNLEPGAHHYKYIVNGEWQHYAGAPTSVDPMGNVNNTLTAEFVAADTGNTAVLSTGEMGVASGSDFLLDAPTVDKAGAGMRGSRGSGGYDNDVGNTLGSPGGSSTTRGTSTSPDPPTPVGRPGPLAAASATGMTRPCRSPDPPPQSAAVAARSAPAFTLSASLPRATRKAEAEPGGAGPTRPAAPGSRYGGAGSGRRVCGSAAAASAALVAASMPPSSPPESYTCSVPPDVSKAWLSAGGGSLRRTGAGNMNPLAAAVAVGGHADEPPSLPPILVTPSIRAGVTTGCSSAPLAASRRDSMGHVLIGHLFVSLQSTPPQLPPPPPPSARGRLPPGHLAARHVPGNGAGGVDIWESGGDQCVDAEGAVVVAVVRRYATKRVTSLVYLPETVS